VTAARVDKAEDTPMKHGHIDYRVGWIAAIVAVAGILFLSADIAIKHSSSPAASTASGANTFASAHTSHPAETQ
jgi:hypothetical protein